MHRVTMTFSNLSVSQQIACQQLTSHISAWAAIPVALTVNHPIRSLPGSAVDTTERLAGFASQIRTYERSLLKPLNVDQGVLDYFLGFNKNYFTAFSQSRGLWLDHSVRVQLVQDDMEPLSRTLRSLEQGVAELRAAQKAEEEADVDSLYSDIEKLRLIIASRAGWAEELAPLIATEPCEAVSIFYDDNMRILRALQPMTGALNVYHSRRPSFRPVADVVEG